MTRWGLLGSVVLVGFGVFLCPPTLAQDTVIPPKPSYQDEWMSTTEVRSSPFLELRNDQGPDTPEGPVVPDTPTVDSGDSDEEGGSDSPSNGETTGEPEEPREPEATKTTEETETTEKQKESDPEPEDEQSQHPSEESPEADERTTEEPDKSTEDSDKPRKLSTEESEPGDLAGEVLRKATPLDTEGLLFSFEPSIESVTLHEIPLTMPAINAELSRPTSPSREPSNWWFWWEYRYWGFGGLVVSFITGMFFWFRQEKVTVLERKHPSTEDFFKDEPVEPSGEAKDISQASETSGLEVSGSRTSDPAAGEPQRSRPPEPSESLVEILDEHGIEDEHRQLVESYFDQGLSRGEVAEQSELGDGEVGLVLDLADRIKEEQAHGEGA